MGLATSGLCHCRCDCGGDTGLRRCARFVQLTPRHAPDWTYRTAISWCFTWPNTGGVIFWGCLLPLLAQTTGNALAVILTALLFALLHQPSDIAHWITFTARGAAYGWIRVASRASAAAAVMHATCNLVLFFFAVLFSPKHCPTEDFLQDPKTSGRAAERSTR